MITFQIRTPLETNSVFKYFKKIKLKLGLNFISVHFELRTNVGVRYIWFFLLVLFSVAVLFFRVARWLDIISVMFRVVVAFLFGRLLVGTVNIGYDVPKMFQNQFLQNVCI